MNQRWRKGRSTFLPPGETIRTSEYDVAAIAGDGPAKAFVLTHHYARTYPAARLRFGLYHRGALAGVAVFAHPCNDRTVTNVFGGRAIDSVELGRFVLPDSVAFNGETWFLARCFRDLRSEGLAGVVSFSDPVARRAADGRLVEPGHVGTIYQAFGGVLLGRGTPRILRLLPDGQALSPRALQKIVAGEQGWRYAAAQLERHGATPPPAERRQWLRQWLDRLTRPLRHPGNFKYAWGLRASVIGALPRSQPYPKQGLQEAA